MMLPQAYFLVTHGSRDRTSWQSLQELVALTQALVSVPIGGGCLEGQALSLAEQLQKFGEQLQAEEIPPTPLKKGGKSFLKVPPFKGDSNSLKVPLFKGGSNSLEVPLFKGDLGGSVSGSPSTETYCHIAVIPLFLLRGVHVCEDLPREVAIVQAHFATQPQFKLKFKLTEHLGSHPKIPLLLENEFAQFPVPKHTARILLAHGSRQMAANQLIAALATQVGAIAAYWAVAPSLEIQIEHLLSKGVKDIVVMPYLLFAGGITEAIAQKIAAYQNRARVTLAPMPLSPARIVELAIS